MTAPRPLGRHQRHDERSRAYALAELPLDKAPKVVDHARMIPVLDQGQIGSCTANALLGCLGTAPWGDKLNLRGFPVAGFDEALALDVYHAETLIDDREIPGHYPPDDTGSAGIYSMRVAKARGWVDGYRHAFSLNAALSALVAGPVSVGVPWYNSMFDVGADGHMRVDFSSGVAGGHQFTVDGYDLRAGVVWMTNSWGLSWGRHGRAAIPINAFSGLLRQGGDVVQPTFK